MSAKSKHYGDVANWIVDVINSCTHPMQEITAHKLMTQFKILYRDLDARSLISIDRRMRETCEQKFYGATIGVIREIKE